MGVVYRARYVGNNRMVAVKLVPDDIAANPTLVSRFERELEVLKQLRHPNIVHCFGGICESKQRFYAMELVDGGTLHNLLHEVGKLPWETVIDYGLQMCAGLQCAHEMNVVHRDVKPGNFLITKTGKLKLSDFGLAIVIAAQRITSAGKTMGTFHYMAPEQIRGKPPVTNKTDLYALGCVFFEMLTGSPPFDAEAAAEVLHKHLKEPAPRVRDLEPSCPPELDKLIGELLEKSPESRPDSARTVANRLKRISAAPSTVKSSMALTPTAPRALIENDSVSVASVPVPTAVRTTGMSWISLLLLAVALLVAGVSFVNAWQWKARATQAERAVQDLYLQGSRELKLALIGTMGQLDSLQPKTEQLLIDQLKSEDQQVRLAVVQLMARKPDLARAATGELAQVQRTDPDPAVRNQVEQAIAAGKQPDAGRPWWSRLLGWTISLVVIVVLAVAANSGWKWARSHAVIPGI